MDAGDGAAAQREVQVGAAADLKRERFDVDAALDAVGDETPVQRPDCRFGVHGVASGPAAASAAAAAPPAERAGWPRPAWSANFNIAHGIEMPLSGNRQCGNGRRTGRPAQPASVRDQTCGRLGLFRPSAQSFKVLPRRTPQSRPVALHVLSSQRPVLRLRLDRVRSPHRHITNSPSAGTRTSRAATMYDRHAASHSRTAVADRLGHDLSAAGPGVDQGDGAECHLYRGAAAQAPGARRRPAPAGMLAQNACLPFGMITEIMNSLRKRQLVVHSNGNTFNDYEYALTEAGPDPGAPAAARIGLRRPGAGDADRLHPVGRSPVDRQRVPRRGAARARPARASPSSRGCWRASARRSTPAPDCFCSERRATARRPWPATSRSASASTSGCRTRSSKTVS